MANGRGIDERRKSGLTRLTLGIAECRNAGLSIPVAFARALEDIEDRFPDMTEHELDELALLREWLVSDSDGYRDMMELKLHDMVIEGGKKAAI